MLLRQIVPATVFATFLNAPCTSLRLAQPGPDSVTIYLVVGKANGETIFFPTDRYECITKFENEAQVPISAIAAGDLRNMGKSELVTITDNGNLTSLSFPHGAPTGGPVCLFSQQINSNICSAEVLDLDGDGLVELLVLMTDRVVRSYRFVEELSRLVPLNKWEMPSHISGWSLGAGSTNFALLSQSEELHYIRLDLGPGNEVRVHQTPPAAPPPNANDQQPKSATTTTTAEETKEEASAELPVPSSATIATSVPLTQLVVAKRLLSVHLFHCMVRRIVLVDDATGQQMALHNSSEADVACCSASIFTSGLRTLTTVDPWGLMSVYAWHEQDQMEKARFPVASCRVMRDVDFVCTSPGPRNERGEDNDDQQQQQSGRHLHLFIGVVNIFSRIAIFSIDLSHHLDDHHRETKESTNKSY